MTATPERRKRIRRDWYRGIGRANWYRVRESADHPLDAVRVPARRLNISEHPDDVLRVWRMTWVVEAHLRPDPRLVERSRTALEPVGWDEGPMRAHLEYLTRLRDAHIQMDSPTPARLIARCGLGPLTETEAWEVASTIAKRLDVDPHNPKKRPHFADWTGQDEISTDACSPCEDRGPTARLTWGRARA